MVQKNAFSSVTLSPPSLPEQHIPPVETQTHLCMSLITSAKIIHIRICSWLPVVSPLAGIGFYLSGYSQQLVCSGP